MLTMVKDNTGQAETDPYDFEANEAMEEMRGYLGVNAKTALCKTCTWCSARSFGCQAVKWHICVIGERTVTVS